MLCMDLYDSYDYCYVSTAFQILCCCYIMDGFLRILLILELEYIFLSIGLFNLFLVLYELVVAHASC